MISQSRIPRSARWGVPAGAVALTGVLAAGFAMSGAQAAPALPARTAVQLLAAVSSARVPPPMTAVVQESASLGIPDLPSFGSSDPLSALSWLSGSHTVKIWYADQAHVRIAVPVQLGESDVRLDGRNVWYWNSRTSQATHLVLPAQAAAPQDSGTAIAGVAPTPQQVARQVLAAIGPTTQVGLQQNVTIAGQPAYQISLSPRDHRSLIGEVRIAIDARQALPLRVQIFARGSGSPAFQVGFTSLQLGTPAAANFAFAAPPGATVKTIKVPPGAAAGLFGGLPPGMISDHGGGFVGVPGATAGPRRVAMERLRAVMIGRAVALKGLPKGPIAVRLPAHGAELRDLVRAFAAHLPKGLTAAQRQAALKKFTAVLSGAAVSGRAGVSVPVAVPPGGWVGYGPGAVPPALGVTAGLGLPAGPGPTVLGKDWLTVVAFPAGGLSASGVGPLIGRVPVGAPAGRASASGASASSSKMIRGPASAAAANAASGPPGQALAILGALLHAARPVHGAWGSGRLLTTSLVSVLLTSNGRILVGAVTPSVLYADAAQLK